MDEAQRKVRKRHTPEWEKAALNLRANRAAEAGERAKLLKSRRLLLEQQLFTADEVKGYFGRVLGGLRVQLTELGPNLAPRVNPADPAMAATIISEAIHAILQSASDQVERFVPQRRQLARPGRVDKGKPAAAAEALGEPVG